MTGIHDRSFRFNLKEMKNPAPVTLLVSSTDKFQGQEADVVIISLVQTHGHGFLDSPNRMNVALTRARRKRIIVGRHSNFLGSKDEMLKEMASRHSGAALIN
jgi:superfamily I DNA and/or RNA helicase